jgi:hypothetical protein
LITLDNRRGVCISEKGNLHLWKRNSSLRVRTMLWGRSSKPGYRAARLKQRGCSRSHIGSGGLAGLAATIGGELKSHAPFTVLGALSGVAIMIGLSMAAVPHSVSVRLFWGLHPLHVFMSALVTTAMYTLHSRRGPWTSILVGYVGAIGIATLSDCVIPYIGETLLGLPKRAIHVGFIEKWWLVNPLAAAGIFVGYCWPRTRYPHAAHVLLSTWASLFHTMMAMGQQPDVWTFVGVGVFLFLAVWVPCCTSDIVFPLLFSKDPHR